MTVHCVMHINVRASLDKIERCREFYCDILGLQVGPRPPFSSSGYWLYADGAPIVHLVVETGSHPGADSEQAALDHVAFCCTDLGGTLASLKAHAVSYRVSAVPTTDILQLNFKDPAGVGVELSFDTTPQEYDAFELLKRAAES
jgi:catechol-2,3-dioxygenase